MKINLVLILLSLFAIPAGAQVKVPSCMDKKERMEYNNNRLLLYRDEMEQKFLTRGFVQGTLVSVMEDYQKHIHFEVDLDQNLNTTDDRLEVIYSTKFGAAPPYKAGDTVIACGDFIVDHQAPHGAILHWLHSSPELKKHAHGFLIINDVIAGTAIPAKDLKE